METDIYIYQWNREESLEINPHIHSQLIFNKVPKAGGKVVFNK